jgi:hypothetical protein
VYGFGTAFPVCRRLNSLPPIRSAYETDWPAPALTTPFVTVRLETGAPSFADAMSSSAARASAAAWRTPAGPVSVPVDWLPAVVPWSGVTHVSDWTNLTFSNGTSSSSATSCIDAVTVPWPSSTLPVFIVTVPSPPIAIHESIWAGSIAAGPIGKSLTAANAAFGLSSLGAPTATTSAPVPLTKVRRLKARGSEVVTVISASLLTPSPSRRSGSRRGCGSGCRTGRGTASSAA